MFTAVVERRREIGVLRALGARRGQIVALYLIESGLLGLLGGVVGLGAGLGLAQSFIALVGVSGALNAPGIAVVPNGALLGAALLGSLGLGLLAGGWPAWRAAGLPPAEALRLE